MKTICVIPARWGSERFPGKPLHPLCGKPMVLWTMEAAARIDGIDDVLVATDDTRIAEAVEKAGRTAVMTSPACPSGTDRIYEAIRDIDGDVIVNVQGDEPLMPVDAVKAAIAELARTGCDTATACVPIRRREDFEAPHLVKVVRDVDNRALYFSRSPIPSLARRDPADMTAENYVYGYKHFGLYVYRREALERFCKLDPSYLERTEKLEQLRMLENGMTIQCVTSATDSVGVDIPDDVGRVERLLPG